MIRFQKPGPGVPYVHCCLLDRECWEHYKKYYTPLRLYLNCLVNKKGHPIFIPIWGERRHDRWFASLTRVDVRSPRE